MRKFHLFFCMLNAALFLSADDYTAFMIGIKPRVENIEETLHSLTTFTPFCSQGYRWYADPMIFKYEGKNYLFYENFPLDTKKGVISCVTINDDFTFSSPIDVLEESFHLSFPYVFQDESKIYMIPETYDIQELVLYEAVEFPNQWKKCKTLVKGDKKFSDPIIFQHNGYYWLFATVNMYEIVIYFSKSLKGPFKPHPINEKQLIGRNAGGVFLYKDMLIRPVMDCAQGYGKAMELRSIVDLSPTTFSEKTLWRIEPDWMEGLRGTHTFSVNEDMVIYDGYLNHSLLMQYLNSSAN